MKLSDLIKASDCLCHSSYLTDLNCDISTDTRTIKSGDFYLPLKGANFDGEKFIGNAIEKGAMGSFYTDEKFIENLQNDNNVFIKVENTLETYLKLANYRRNKLNFTVIAITGSSGKTTTKELVSTVVNTKFRTFKTPLNHNNEIGFCQTIFGAPDDTQVLVLEMGMRGLGEIELLSKYAEPDITIICNVGTAHIGRLGSRENIAKAKCEIVKYQRGNTFIAHNDELIKRTVDFSGEKIFYSIKDVDILEKKSNYSKFKYKGNIYELNVGGEYNIENALSAINTGYSLGIKTDFIIKGLKQYKPIEKRWEKIEAGGFNFINDSYNANPDSMRAFVDTIIDLYSNYVIVLGNMGELGEKEGMYHKELGKYINDHKKLDKHSIIISIGDLAKNITDSIDKCKTAHFKSKADASKYIKTNINPQTNIFLKASRLMKFEDIISEF